jgi:hypothetical protein
MPPADPAALGKWLGGIQVALGLSLLVVGLRARYRPAESAALGAMILISGSLRLLSGVIAEGILIPVGVALFAAALVWFVRGYRASRARTRELPTERQAKS